MAWFKENVTLHISLMSKTLLHIISIAIVKMEVHNRLQIDTINFTKALRLGKSIENKERLIRVKIKSTKQKYDILNKTYILKGSQIFRNIYK